MSTETTGPAPKTELAAPSTLPPQLGETMPPAFSPSQGERAGGPGRDFGPDAARSPWLKLIGRFGWKGAGLLVLAVCAVAAWWFFTRTAAATNAANNASAAPSTNLPVAVVRVIREDVYNELTIPAEFRPYLEVELHAKVSGFVEQINVDFGDEVKAGQLLAKLEVPELKNDLDRAVAAAKRAEADYHEAHVTYSRLQSVDHASPNMIAQ
jgi:multidrug efflux pump subunit AcrA (membrane-fusion protein)